MKKLIHILIFLIIVTNFSFSKDSKSEKKIIFTEKAPNPIGPYSQAVRAGNFLYLSGQIAIDPKSEKMLDGTIEDETKLIMENISKILLAANFELKDIVKTTIYMTNLQDFNKVNEIYSKYFKSEFPARETVQVVALPKNAKIEISVVAYKDTKK